MPPENERARPAGSKNSESQGGLSVFDTAIAITITGGLVATMISATSSLMDATRARVTESALATARDALVAYAAAHNGCLPFAADLEGGLPDATDTGIGVLDIHGADLPWAELDLPDTFLDGDGLRIQYYVASVYTDDGSDPNEITCAAGHRGAEWTPWASYPGTASDPYYVYYTPSGGDRRLYRIIGTLPPGTSPNAVDPSIAVDVTVALPDSLLDVRRGPMLNANSGGQKDVISAQNAFVLIAPGVNRNAELGARHIRDANHGGNGAPNSAWPTGYNTVDGVTFSTAREIDGNDNTNSGDDTLLVVSFLTYKTELKNKYGMHMEPFCDGSC